MALEFNADKTKVKNPDTGRFVNVDGAIGKKLIEKYGEKVKQASPVPVKQASPASSPKNMFLSEYNKLPNGYKNQFIMMLSKIITNPKNTLIPNDKQQEYFTMYVKESTKEVTQKNTSELMRYILSNFSNVLTDDVLMTLLNKMMDFKNMKYPTLEEMRTQKKKYNIRLLEPQEKIKFMDELLSMLNGSMTKDKQRIVNDLHMIKKLTDDYDVDKGMMLDDLLNLVVNMYNVEYTTLLKKYNLRDNDNDVQVYEKYNFVKKASDLPVFKK